MHRFDKITADKGEGEILQVLVACGSLSSVLKKGVAFGRSHFEAGDGRESTEDHRIVIIINTNGFHSKYEQKQK